MGIYYFAVDEKSEEYFYAPKGFAVKAPGYFCPTNPFPGMVMMMNYYNSNFKIVNDMVYELPDGFKEITEEVYKKYIEIFKEK